MKKFTNQYVALLFAAATVFSVGCDDNDEIAVDPNAEFDVILNVEEGKTPVNENVEVDANTKSTILAKVTFTATSDIKMYRLYITKNVAGAGEEIYEPTEDIDLKGDGAVDLEKDNKSTFEFQFKLPVPSGVSTGTVVYKFWTTTGNGDFRDQTKRLAVGPGTITLKYGTGSNPAAPVKTLSATILAAPLLDGTSLTFLSLANNTVYKISQGAEYAAFWDFGYYYTNANGAALASTSYYETAFSDPNTGTPFVDVTGIAGTEDLNHAYFAKSSKTAAQFAAVTKASDITIANTPTAEKITNLVKDDVIEFVDDYKKKGYIHVVDIVTGTGSTGQIKIEVKMQP